MVPVLEREHSSNVQFVDPISGVLAHSFHEHRNLRRVLLHAVDEPELKGAPTLLRADPASAAGSLSLQSGFRSGSRFAWRRSCLWHFSRERYRCLRPREVERDCEDLPYLCADPPEERTHAPRLVPPASEGTGAVA